LDEEIHMAKKRGDIIEHSEPTSAPVGEKPAWLKKRLDWLMDQRFGMIIHWAPYSQWDCTESWPLVPADTWARPDNLKCWNERGRDLARFSKDYWNLNRTFNPTSFDPSAWAELARYAGMRYVAFTTKHHDGFCMFDTKTTDYRITHPDCPFHSNPRANIVKEVFDAFRKKGMAISCYFSKSDWHSPYYWSPDSPAIDRNPNYDTHRNPKRWQQFVTFVHSQVEELMTQYGPIACLWLDGGQVRPPDQDIQMAKMAAMARKHQPGLIIADRTVGGDYEDIITPEQQIPDKPLGVPWESCMTLGNAWKYVPGDKYKSAREVIHMLVETTAKGGNLLLGIGPDPFGVIPPEAADRLREVGDWLHINGAAIYGTRPVAPYKSGKVRFTAKDPFTYAIILEREGEGATQRRITIEGLRPKPGSAMQLLGYPDVIPWDDVGNGFSVALPKDAADAHAWVLEFVR
jgi:alpha-L-fucosidase